MHEIIYIITREGYSFVCERARQNKQVNSKLIKTNQLTAQDNLCSYIEVSCRIIRTAVFVFESVEILLITQLMHLRPPTKAYCLLINKL